MKAGQALLISNISVGEIDGRDLDRHVVDGLLMAAAFMLLPTTAPRGRRCFSMCRRRTTGTWRACRAIRVTDFERRQMAAVRTELDHEYEARTGLVQKPRGRCKPSRIVQHFPDLTG